MKGSRRERKEERARVYRQTRKTIREEGSYENGHVSIHRGFIMFDQTKGRLSKWKDEGGSRWSAFRIVVLPGPTAAPVLLNPSEVLADANLPGS